MESIELLFPILCLLAVAIILLFTRYNNKLPRYEAPPPPPQKKDNKETISKRLYIVTHVISGIMSSNECGIAHHPKTAVEWAYSIADEILEEEGRRKIAEVTKNTKH